MSEICIFISTLENTGFNMSVAVGPSPAERIEELRPSLGSRDNHSNLLKPLNVELFFLFICVWLRMVAALPVQLISVSRTYVGQLIAACH